MYVAKSYIHLLLRTVSMIVGVLIAFASTEAKAALYINELMQSNIDAVYVDHQFPDSWAELYNAGEEDLNLAGYGIGDSNDFKKAYILPDYTIATKGYALVYCDKADSLMHADFKIDTGKNTQLYLFDPQGAVIDRLNIPKKMPAPNVAYARAYDGSSTWGYALMSTPGTENTGGVVDNKKILDDVAFSPKGQVIEGHEPINVTLSYPSALKDRVTIVYTTDGSEPTNDNGLTYTTPIIVDSTTVIRAKALCDGYVSVPSVTNSYIYLEREQRIPVVSIVTDESYLYDDEMGIFSDGQKPDGKANWSFNRWRPINIEYFEPYDTESSINQLCEFRVHGQFTRQFPLKSLTVKTSKRFGVKRFYHALWPKDKPKVDEPQSFVLRNGGNDFARAYLRDGITQRVVGRHTDCLDWQGYTSVIVYINGEYQAMMALREPANEDNIAANYGGLEDIDLVENWSVIKEGSEHALDGFKVFVKSNHAYEKWCEMFDIDSYLTYWALKYWTYETDFPINNIMMWRRNDTAEQQPWRWIIKDCDAEMGLYYSFNYTSSYNEYVNRNKNSYNTGFVLYFHMMNCPEVRNKYLNHIIAHCGDFLNARTFLEVLEETLDESHGEIYISDAKWRGSVSWGAEHDLDYALNHLRKYIEGRQMYMPSIIRDDFGLGETVGLEINQGISKDLLAGMRMTYNGVPLSSAAFDGFDYDGRHIDVKASVIQDSFHVKGWIVRRGDKMDYYAGDSLSLDVKRGEKYVIHTLLGEGGNVSALDNAEVDAYDCIGVKVSGLTLSISSMEPINAIEIYNASGMLVSGSSYISGRSSSIAFEVSAHGMYIVKVQDANGRVSVRRVVL